MCALMDLLAYTEILSSSSLVWLLFQFQVDKTHVGWTQAPVLQSTTKTHINACLVIVVEAPIGITYCLVTYPNLNHHN